MYIPSHFEESRPDVLHELMRERPLATLVTASAAGLEANHLPLHWSPEPAPLGTLRGHVARANPLWRQLAPDGAAVLAIFHGPQAYVTPSWYPAKAEHGRVVPTWNYVVVHAHGTLRAVDDAAWLRAQLAALTAASEAGRAPPWQVADAPAEFVDRLIAGIVGIEIAISRIEGKSKVSQNQSAANRAGVVRGLRADGDAGALDMAAWIEAAGSPD
jgi:transcriptional regulator